MRPSAAGFALHLARRSGKQHAVVDNADDLNHAVTSRAIDNDVSWQTDTLASLCSVSSKPQRIRPHADNLCNLMRAAEVGGSAEGSEDGQHQPVVTAGSLDAPFAGACEKDTVDLIFCRPKKAVAQRAEMSADRLLRKRSMVRWWSASLSSGVESVTNRPLAISASARSTMPAMSSSASR